MSTLLNIMEKKQSGEIKVKEEEIYTSKMLGEDIVVRKRPLSEFMEILQEAQSENEIQAMNYMIHAFCPMFQDPDGVKATMEYYENDKGVKIGSPRDLPEYVFESNMKEMGDIVEIISSFYDVDEVGEDIKN